MRLLFLTAETCPTFRADVAVLFGKYLPRHGVLSDIVTGGTPGQTGSVEWGGGETLLCDISGGQAKKHIKTLLHGIKHLFAADRLRYQAIQVRDMPVLAAFGLLAARFKGLPFYYWMSFPMPEGQIMLARERGLSAGLMKFLFPWVSGRVGRVLLYHVVLPHADHIFVQSERMLEDMASRGIASAKMTPVPMGVDIEDIQLDGLRPTADPRLAGRRVLVYLGIQDRPRRIELMFEMLALVKKKVPDVLLVLVGDTEDKVHRSWLRQQSIAAGVSDNLLWTGWLPIKEGWRYVMAAEVGLSPFPRGFLLDSASPTKVPEYLALGIPVVCNDNPDQERVIGDSGAGLCVPYTAERFADAVMSILESDDGQRKAMRDGGRLHVLHHRDYRMLGEKLASNYKALLTPYARVNE
ncbi:MAG: glycosyltransferase [Thiobacillus sp.]|nr:glycosyltransferase [Thiobacillus sp.]